MIEQTQPTQLNETHKERLAPYKLYSFLLNAEQPLVTVVGPQLVEVRTGPMSRKFKCRHSRIHEWLTWLKARGLINIPKKAHGKWTVQIHIPKNLRAETK